MNFQTRSLPNIKKEQKHNFETARKHFRIGKKDHLKYYILVPLVIILVFFALRGIGWTYDHAVNFKLLDFVWNLTSDLKTTDDHTTILLLGHSGKKHDGGELTDTIIAATFDHRLKTVSLLSIPRDLFVSISGYEPMRINAVWKVGEMQKQNNDDGYKLVQTAVEGIIGQKIDYHARVDFDGFERIVDAIGGIEVDVENSFIDHQYPTEDLYWKTISFSKGLQHMSGAKALQFARSRHGNSGEGSDFKRAIRQQKIISAVYDKAMSRGVLSDPGKLREIYTAFQSTIETDLNIREILALAKFGLEFNRENIYSFTLSDGANGFLYTPNVEERNQYYGGSFILLPLGNDWDMIHDFVKMIWYYGEIYQEKAAIRVLNGTSIQGLAQSCQSFLKRYGLNVVDIANAKNLYKSTEIYDHTLNSKPKTMQILRDLTGGEWVDQITETQPTTAEITIITGKKTKCKTW
ncbi:MAG: LCP family protein [Patescibacteria group bacterium]|nr:LCP family protein [Patescibacteria group bacterium]